MSETQKSVHEWCKVTFPRFMGQQGRATAVLEEAVELALAAGVNTETIYATVRVPIMKESTRNQANAPEEIADVLVSLYSCAEEMGLDAHAELGKKMELNRSRPTEYYAEKTAQKEGLGYILPDIQRTHGVPGSLEGEDNAASCNGVPR